MPYGITQQDWDVLVPAKDFTRVLKQIAAQNKSESWVFFTWCNPDCVGDLKKCFKANGYADCYMFYWVKPNHNTMTRVSSFTSCVEVGILACYPHAGSVKWNVSLNARERPNYVILPTVTTLDKTPMNVPVNPCQKPPGLSQYILSQICMPSETVLVLGSGAMGDVKGAILCGLDVVGVEMDRDQFVASQKILLNFKGELKEALTLKLTQQGSSQSSSSSSSSSGNVVSDSEKSEGKMVAAANKEISCPHCGDKIPDGDIPFTCAGPLCVANPAFKYHEKCTTVYQSMVYCNDCMQQVNDVVADSQVETQPTESLGY